MMLKTGFYNMDCMDGMKEFPDGYFDLAIVDPPYGDGGGSGNGKTRADSAECSTGIARTGFHGKVYPSGRNMGEQVRQNIISWDTAPKQDYFKELFRVSRNQIIWGGNYFNLPPTRCFLIWRKTNVPEKFSMAMCEYAWTSFNSNAKVFEHPSFGGKEERFHPTQKPVALYKWILSNYANAGDLILDTHVGSASSLIACEDMGFNYVGFEIDKEYYQKASARLEEFKAQTHMDFYRLLP